MSRWGIAVTATVSSSQHGEPKTRGRVSDGRLTTGYRAPLSGETSGGTGYTWPPGLPFGPTLERARQLDQTAISMLYRRFLPIVYRYALAHVGTAPQAEDVTSETFYAMVDGVASTRAQDESGFTAWLLGIAHHKIARHYRTLRARPETALTLAEDAHPFAVAEEDDPQAVVTARERWSEIVDALQSLTEEQRVVVVYRCALGYSTTEVAEMLGKPENAVRGLQFRALASLSRHLQASERQIQQESKMRKERRGHGTAR
jgi:RNA polymerase sigma-70 factor (ECF subfamily)